MNFNFPLLRPIRILLLPFSFIYFAVIWCRNMLYDKNILKSSFGGTGSISYELASRGVKDLTIVEMDIAMYEFIKKTSTTLGAENFEVVRMDVFKFIQQCTDTFDFIFAGPPYALETIDKLPEMIVEKKLLNSNGWFVLEHTPRNDYSKFPLFKTHRKYGTTIFSIFINSKET